MVIIFVEELFGFIILFLVVGLWCVLLNDGNMTVLLIFDLPFAFISLRYQALVEVFCFWLEVILFLPSLLVVCF